MTDRQRFFQCFDRDLFLQPESQIERMIRQKREAVVGKDRLKALEFRKNIPYISKTSSCIPSESVFSHLPTKSSAVHSFGTSHLK